MLPLASHSAGRGAPTLCLQHDAATFRKSDLKSDFLCWASHRWRGRRAAPAALPEGGLQWPGWFVPLAGFFIAKRGLVPAWNSVPLASNSETASEHDARLSRIRRLRHDGPPAGLSRAPAGGPVAI